MPPSRVFGVGVDIALIHRFERILAGRFAGRFAKKALHPAEIAQLSAMSDEARTPTGASPRATFVASRWAAKEAFTKAVGARLLFPEMRLARKVTPVPAAAAAAAAAAGADAKAAAKAAANADPRPVLVLSGEAAAYVSARALRPLVSITHDGDYAVATCVIEQAEAPAPAPAAPAAPANLDALVEAAVAARVDAAVAAAVSAALDSKVDAAVAAALARASPKQGGDA